MPYARRARVTTVALALLLGAAACSSSGPGVLPGAPPHAAYVDARPGSTLTYDATADGAHGVLVRSVREVDAESSDWELDVAQSIRTGSQVRHADSTEYVRPDGSVERDVATVSDATTSTLVSGTIVLPSPSSCAHRARTAAPVTITVTRGAETVTVRGTATVQCGAAVTVRVPAGVFHARSVVLHYAFALTRETVSVTTTEDLVEGLGAVRVRGAIVAGNRHRTDDLELAHVSDGGASASA